VTEIWPILKIENLAKTYETEFGQLSLFGGLSAEVTEGDFVAITGPTGVGKTTLINMIAGLEDPTQGTLRVLGKNITEMDDNARSEFRARNIGMVFQNSQLLENLDVFQNVELSLVVQGINEPERRKRTEEILDFFGLTRKACARPVALSVGENRKVAIARALVTEPRILLMDEPTGGLDTSAVNILAPLLRGIHHIHKGTILMATNSLNLARLASRELPVSRPRIVMTCQS
jgi:putative ABC transport system ATP-binding protein